MDQKDLFKTYAEDLLKIKKSHIRSLYVFFAVTVALAVTSVFLALLWRPTVGKATIVVAAGSGIAFAGGIVSVVRTLFREKQVSDVLVRMVKQETLSKEDLEKLLAQMKATLSE